MFWLIKIFIIQVSLLFLVSCGGGGIGGVISNSSNAEEDEYNANEGLELIGANSINNVATGSGIKVAVNDTGIDENHQEFSDKTIYGTDFAGTGNAKYDGHGHGSHVAGIIAADKDSSGMRGVAYNATLYSYKIGDNNGNLVGVDTDAEWSNVIDQHDTDDIKVSNNSWGATSSSYSINNVSASWINTNYSNSVASLQTAISNGTIFVFITHNGYRATPSWQAGMPYRIDDIEDGWIAVMAVDHNGKETDYTNRCGLAKDWCVAAPGGGLASDESSGIYSVDANTTNGYERKSGTSMAAPHVSGVLATIFEKFPSLTSAQVRNRLLTTTTYSGLTDTSGNSTTGMSTSTKEAIFGKGLIQPEAATGQIGNFVLPKTSNYYDEENFDISQSKFNLPGGLSNSVQQRILNEKFGAFDSFDGAYFDVSGTEIFNLNKKNTNKISYQTNDIFNKNDKSSNSKLLFYNDSEIKKPFDLLYYSEGPSHDLITEQQWGDKNSFLPNTSFLNQNISQKMEVGLLYNQFNSDVNAFILFPYAEKSNLNGFGLNFNNKISDKLKLLSTISQVNSTANFSIINQPLKSEIVSQNIDFGFQYLANDKLLGFYRSQISNLGEVEQSNFNFGLSDAVTKSNVLGLEYKHNNKNKSTVGLYQPSHFTSGNLNIISPSGRNRDGTIYWQNIDIHVDDNPNHKLFFSSLFSLNENTYLELNLQETNLNNNLINNGEIILNYKF